LLFLFGRERMQLAFFVWCPAVGMKFVHALIAGVTQEFGGRHHSETALLEQSKVMGSSRTGVDTENRLAVVVDHDLCFLGVAFLFARVEPALFFWGRSMRCSLASTTTTVKSREPSCNAFLPGT